MTLPHRIADDVEPAAANLRTGPPRDAASSDLADNLSLLLSRLGRLVRREAPAPVGPGSLAALATLRRWGPMRLGDLALREGVAPPTLTRMIATLEDAGYVVRHPDPGDRRAVRVSITPDGEEVVAVALAARAEVFRLRLDGLPGEDRDALAAAVPALRALAGDGN